MKEVEYIIWKSRRQRRRDESEFDSESVSPYVWMDNLLEDRMKLENKMRLKVKMRLEDEIRDALDNLAHKSSQSRVTALKNLFKTLRKGAIPEFIHDFHFTIYEAVERSLKKGGTAEIIAAAELAPAVYLQLGAPPSANTILPILKTLVGDPTISPLVRAKCCSALGIIEFFIRENQGYAEVSTLSSMTLLRNIFSASCLKKGGTVPYVAAEVAVLHAASIDSWTLLLTTLHPKDIITYIEDKTLISLEALSELLESPHLEVSLAAGEALTVVFEGARNVSKHFADDLLDDLIETFKKLSRRSRKYRTKKDWKQQKATFRDILQYFEDGIVPVSQIKFHDFKMKTEKNGRNYLEKKLDKFDHRRRNKLDLDTWAKKKQYDILCHLVGPQGLRVNALLRSIFGVTVPVVSGIPLPDVSEEDIDELTVEAQTSPKEMTKVMRKERDKRSDFYQSFYIL